MQQPLPCVVARHLALIAASTFAGLSSMALAQGTPVAAAPATVLSVGDPAPPIAISEWVQGSEVAAFAEGKVTVLEFWATWCGPCRTSIPHLSDLYDRFKGENVTFIGLSDEDRAKVEAFLAKDGWKEKMRYTVATDPDRSVHSDYMKAAGRGGIPSAFIIGKTGRVEWIGHPMVGMDEALEQIVHDTWDRQAFKATYEAEQAAARARDAMMAKLRAATKTAKESGNWDGVVALYDELLAAEPDNIELAIGKIETLLGKANRPTEGYAAARALAARKELPPMVWNDLAWKIATDKSIATRDLAFARELAEKAVAATNGKNAAVIDTLARIHWEAGDKAKAIELQKQAVALEGSGPMADGLRKTLDEYTKPAAN